MTDITDPVPIPVPEAAPSLSDLHTALTEAENAYALALRTRWDTAALRNQAVTTAFSALETAHLTYTAAAIAEETTGFACFHVKGIKQSGSTVEFTIYPQGEGMTPEPGTEGSAAFYAATDLFNWLAFYFSGGEE